MIRPAAVFIRLGIFLTSVLCSPVWAKSSNEAGSHNRCHWAHRQIRHVSVWQGVVDPRLQLMTSAGAGIAAAIAIDRSPVS